jgi:hypothetical protein
MEPEHQERENRVKVGTVSSVLLELWGLQQCLLIFLYISWYFKWPMKAIDWQGKNEDLSVSLNNDAWMLIKG